MVPILVNSVTIDCKNPGALADFYARLLGWAVLLRNKDFVSIGTPGFPVRIGFQLNELYVPPVWPEQEGCPQQMEHLDFKATDRADMEAIVRHAVHCGGKIAPEQYSEDWTVLFDPEGHPFCIDTL
ncbi:MAG TPA: VOC family protein [Candidatus Cryosericum sp.]|nr:VOC family protein [Candidatus Cryosericum sp.]